MEMAHRLTSGGKCEAIHGHSWYVYLSIAGPVDATGKILEFGAVKAKFRGHLDRVYDHKLVLNVRDPWAKVSRRELTTPEALPGLQIMNGDPTTENVARLIFDWAKQEFGDSFKYRVDVWETRVNCASYGDW